MDQQLDPHQTLLQQFMLREGDLVNGKIPNSFFHTGSIGDVWASLPSIRECCRQVGKKAIYYLRPDVEAVYYEGAVHPTVNSSGEQVGLNQEMIRMMIPLLKAQPYIEDAKIHTYEKIRVFMNAIRYTFVNMPYHDLRRWYFFIYPDTQCDLSKQYIFVPDTDKDFAKNKMIVARTERYQNKDINYNFLKKYEENLVFSGTELERIIFNARFGLNIPRLEINDFLELAQALQQSVGLLSNQTQIFQIAEGLKIPRIVELCRFAPNVDPVGENAFGSYGQAAHEYCVDRLFKIKKTPMASLN
jgi:hypothetical protein